MHAFGKINNHVADFKTSVFFLNFLYRPGDSWSRQNNMGILKTTKVILVELMIK